MIASVSSKLLASRIGYITRRQGIATAAFISATLGLSACGGSSSATPLGPQTLQRSTALEAAHGLAAAACLSMSCFYVTNTPANRHDGGSYVLAFAADANGNLAPVATIRGAKTDLGNPQGVALDAGGRIYVTNMNAPARILVFAAGSNGNVAPLRSISGARTGLKFPVAVTLDSDGNIYVVDLESESSASGSVSVFAADANGNVPPL
ncbi:MAG: hypothetical protein JO060_01270, partial [Candidatus Eremiobacteraeota bacterium]|nr:hypothetical protein [Candidatus Eremiobacteraeota bacterium]